MHTLLKQNISPLNAIFLFCAMLASNTIVGMESTKKQQYQQLQITIENNLEKQLNFIFPTWNHTNNPYSLAMGMEILPNQKQTITLSFPKSPWLSFFLPYGTKSRIQLDLTKDQKNIFIKKDPLAKDEIIIEDDTQKKLTGTLGITNK